MAALKDVAMEMYERMEQGDAPTMTLPVRTKSNIGFDEKTSVYTYKDKKTIRKGAELGSAKRLLKALHVIEFIEDMIQQGKTSTLREMYYISEGWGHGKFGNQSDSDNLAEDLEIVSKMPIGLGLLIVRSITFLAVDIGHEMLLVIVVVQMTSFYADKMSSQPTGIAPLVRY